MDQFKTFIQHPDNSCYEGQDRNEEVLYLFRRSIITNIPWLFITVLLALLPFILGSIVRASSFNPLEYLNPTFTFILALFWYLFVFGFFFQNLLNWFFNVYLISSKKILDVDFHGLIYKNVSEAPLASIEDVTSNVSGTLGVIFNVGDVLIQTAAEKREFEFSKVDNPANIRDIISDIVASLPGHNN